MPILVLIDVSLSMSVPLEGVIVPSTDSDSSNVTSRRSAAISGVLSFLEYLELQNRHEFVSLGSFSEDVEMTEFTRQYGSLKDLLTKSNAYYLRTNTNIVDNLRGVFNRCVAVWGSNVLCHVVLLTDCAGYCEKFEQLVNSITILERKDPLPPLVKHDVDHVASDGQVFVQEFRQLYKRGQFALHIICVNSATTNDPVVQHNAQLCRKLVDLFENGGSFRFIDLTTPTSWLSSFRNLADRLSAPSSTVLRCGTFSSHVDILPAIRPIRKEQAFDVVVGQLGVAIEIIGFLKPGEIGSPPVTSRHLILAGTPNTENVDPKTLDDEKGPNFCVLLHGAMKVEDVVAICEIGPNWYGYIHHLQRTKHSNLILHCFEPGIDAVPWLGNLDQLALRPFIGPPNALAAQKSPFPISSKSKPSYAIANPNWIHHYGLQADIQKVLRYARKLPEKEPQFYQELSRVTNHALSLGFVELFTILARTFEKEIVTMGPNSPPTPILNTVINVLLSGRLKYGDPLAQFSK